MGPLALLGRGAIAAARGAKLGVARFRRGVRNAFGKEGWATNALWAQQMARELIGQFTPAISHQVVVRIVGKPNSSLNDLYFLAISIASGVVTKMPINSLHAFNGKIEFMSKTVTITLGYEAGGLQTIGPGNNPVNKFINDPILYGQYPLFLKIDPAIKVTARNPINGAVERVINPGQVAITSEALGNPGLNNENKTRDNERLQDGKILQGNLLAGPASLINPRDNVPQPLNNVTLRGIKDNQRAFLAKLFGITVL